MDLKSQLCKLLGEASVKEQELLSNHTTLRIGGPADILVMPASVDQIKKCVRMCQEEQVPYFILGRGSNLLVSDQGFRGVVIKLGMPFSAITVGAAKEELETEEGKKEAVLVEAMAGVTLARLANVLAEEGLSGFECESGIPGTLGGAVVMNAGAYGGEISDHIVSATVLTPEGSVEELSREELKLGYRSSIVQQTEGMVVLSAKFLFPRGNREQIRARMEELNAKRRQKQPLEYPSAGSTFKRPEGYFAGKLIEDAGLKGFRVGGIEVSQKHCGFVINKEHGTAAQMAELMQQVDRIVFEKFGVHLEPEVRRLGEFS